MSWMDGILTHIVSYYYSEASWFEGFNNCYGSVDGNRGSAGCEGRDGGGEVRPQAEPGRGKVCGVGGMVGVKSFSPTLIHTMNTNFVLLILYISDIDNPLLL